jgi:hypothetical protein
VNDGQDGASAPLDPRSNLQHHFCATSAKYRSLVSGVMRRLTLATDSPKIAALFWDPIQTWLGQDVNDGQDGASAPLDPRSNLQHHFCATSAKYRSLASGVMRRLTLATDSPKIAALFWDPIQTWLGQDLNEEFARSVTGCSRFTPTEPAVRDCWLLIPVELAWTAIRVLVTKIKGCSRGCVGAVSAYLVVRLPLRRGQRPAARLKGGRALVPAQRPTICIFEGMLVCAACFLWT